MEFYKSLDENFRIDSTTKPKSPNTTTDNDNILQINSTNNDLISTIDEKHFLTILEHFLFNNNEQFSKIRKFSDLDKSKDQFFEFLCSKKLKINEKDEIELNFLYKYDAESNSFQIIFNETSEVSKIQNKKRDKWIKAIFLGKICHNFKNPLISIDQLSKILQEKIKGKKFEDVFNTA